jgi:site-specific DNA-cytosine methylase
MKRYYLDLFSGIGGFALGAMWADMKFDGHYFSEVDEYAVNDYAKRFPEAVGLAAKRAGALAIPFNSPANGADTRIVPRRKSGSGGRTGMEFKSV